MTNEEILALAHREAWRYKKSSDPHHSDTYTFNRSTLLEFSRKLVKSEREACAEVCEDEEKRIDALGDKIISDEGDNSLYLAGKCVAAGKCARLIRARSNAKGQAAAKPVACTE